MSTIKANNHQVGQSATATNNFTLYQPTSPDGTVRLGVGNSGATTKDVLTVSSTNVALGNPLQFLSWTTATRPSSPVAGMTGYNSTTGFSETYNGTLWVAAGGLVQQAVQTSDFTAAAGNSYPVNTTSAPVIVTLPASPTAGQQVNVFDYAGTAATNNITISPGSLNINGSTLSLVIFNARTSLTLQYVDATQGWTMVSDGDATLYYQAVPISYAMLGGGGSGSSDQSGYGTYSGGGAAVYRAGSANMRRTAVYTVVVGAGGGNSSSISGTAVSVSATGGGNGSGSGGGSNADYSGANSPSVVTIGNVGGGAGAAANGSGKNGGNGATVTITGSSQTLGGGGAGYDGGGSVSPPGGTPGTGGGGSRFVAGTANTGSGGGGAAAGGSGVVFLSIPTSRYTGIYTGTVAVTTSGSNTILTFTSSGSYTA